MLASVGMESVDAGAARSRISLTRLAAAIWGTMNPELVPGSGVRNAGSSE